ncbi:NADAR family protein [Phormidium pseudopriestleyi FRX01]|uniref:NADAR family protein n=1 Tax=Phormidium pseudopriestleyi FRX01 TaxID=1759528 RepID=A0ABS3FTC5_9CYAN|nr:NADAR domain-containing protein [Phormidium pseudopriestleyi]MBO0350369.1 NADAR family protein [Phormidium pseudopriestleyi FRX01]
MTIYFYKVDEPYGCFSNFSLHGIRRKGLHWPTVEHYYQAHKFIGVEDESIITEIRNAPTPDEAAKLGRDPSRTARSNWDWVKLGIMREAVLTKFLTHLDIQAILLATEDLTIVEDSPTDYFWGCGADRTGPNHLGQMLMSVREEIRGRLQEKESS